MNSFGWNQYGSNIYKKTTSPVLYLKKRLSKQQLNRRELLPISTPAAICTLICDNNVLKTASNKMQALLSHCPYNHAFDRVHEILQEYSNVNS